MCVGAGVHVCRSRCTCHLWMTYLISPMCRLLPSKTASIAFSDDSDDDFSDPSSPDPINCRAQRSMSTPQVSYIVHVCTCVYMCVHVCTCVYMCVHVCTCVYMCVHVCTCVYMCVHVCTCVYMCVRVSPSWHFYVRSYGSLVSLSTTV